MKLMVISLMIVASPHSSYLNLVEINVLLSERMRKIQYQTVHVSECLTPCRHLMPSSGREHTVDE